MRGRGRRGPGGGGGGGGGGRPVGERGRRGGARGAGVEVPAGSWSRAEMFLMETADGLRSGRRIEIDLWRAGVPGDAQYLLWQAMLTARRSGRVPDGPAGPGRHGPGGPAARR